MKTEQELAEAARDEWWNAQEDGEDDPESWLRVVRRILKLCEAELVEVVTETVKECATPKAMGALGAVVPCGECGACRAALHRGVTS